MKISKFFQVFFYFLSTLKYSARIPLGIQFYVQKFSFRQKLSTMFVGIISSIHIVRDFKFMVISLSDPNYTSWPDKSST